MTFRGVPWLSLAAWVPALGALVIALWPAARLASAESASRLSAGSIPVGPRLVARAASALGLLAACATVFFDLAAGGYQFVEDHEWIPSLGARYTLGVDALSAPFVVVAAFAFAVAVFVARDDEPSGAETGTSGDASARPESGVAGDGEKTPLEDEVSEGAAGDGGAGKGSAPVGAVGGASTPDGDGELSGSAGAACLLALQSVTVGALAALDAFLWLALFAAALVPVSLLLSRRTREGSRAASSWLGLGVCAIAVATLAVAALLALTASATARAGIASARASADAISGTAPEAKAVVANALARVEAGAPTMSVPALHALAGARTLAGAPVFPLGAQLALFCAFALALLSRLPAFPLHGWIVGARAEASTRLAIGAGLPLVSVVGLARYCLALAPEASHDGRVVPVVVTLGLVGSVYGALCALDGAYEAGAWRTIAYGSVSRGGLVLVGLFTLTPDGIAGGLALALAGAVATAMLALATALRGRRVTRADKPDALEPTDSELHESELAEAGPGDLESGGPRRRGRVARPWLLAAALAAAGAPGAAALVALLYVLRGAFESSAVVAAFACAAAAIGGLAAAALYRSCARDDAAEPEGPGAVERVALASLLGLSVLFGVYPRPLLAFVARGAQSTAFLVWNAPGDRDRYAPTIEEQERLDRERASQAQEPARETLPAPDALPVPAQPDAVSPGSGGEPPAPNAHVETTPQAEEEPRGGPAPAAPGSGESKPSGDAAPGAGEGAP